MASVRWHAARGGALVAALSAMACGRYSFDVLFDGSDAGPNAVCAAATCTDVDACTLEVCDPVTGCTATGLVTTCTGGDACCPLGCTPDLDADCIERPSVAFDGPATVHVDEAGGAIEVTVSTSAPLPYDASVRVFAFGEATAGVDYELAAAYIVVPANTTTGTLSLPILDDTEAEGWERIQLDLDGSSAFVIGAQSYKDLYVIDDELSVVRPVIGDLAVGADHTCYLAGGGVACFGANFSGQLGDGSTTERPTPVVAFPGGSGVTQIDAAGSPGTVHPPGTTCAVRSGGLWCWGNNGLGQLGDGTTTDRATPTMIYPAGTGITQVSVGPRHTCAVKNGGLVCWGDNLYGQLGIGSTGGTRLTPQTIFADGSAVSAVDAGGWSTCAIVAGGVQCWGSNDRGHLGDGTTTPRPAPITVIPAGSGASSIAVGRWAGCAIVAGGVTCWGINYYGTLGIGVEENLNGTHRYTPRQILASGASSLGAGENAMCAIVDGDVWCWGDGALVPSPVGLGPGATAVESSTTMNGSGASCAIVGGRLHCWARTSSVSRITSEITRSTTPVEVRLPPGRVTDIDGITAFFNRGQCATVDDRMYCWGENGEGWFGDGTILRRTSPTASLVRGDITKIATADAANSRIRCLIVEGGVLCAGDNLNGALGDGSSVMERPTFGWVSGLGPGSGVTRLAGFEGTLCAVVGDGLSCWGRNYAATPTTVFPPGSGVTAVALAGHSCVVIAGGVQCWGENADGELGNGTTTPSATPVEVFPPGSGATEVAVYEGTFRSHSCAIVGGTVHCWGANASGQLGDGTTTPRLVPVTTLVSGTATQVVLSTDRTCAIADGGLMCWGAGFTPTPTTVHYPPGSGVRHATLGSVGTDCAIVGERAYCWGENRYGELGLRIRQANPFEVWGPLIVP